MADAVVKNDIRHFLGMVTNADSEDLKPEYCREIDSFEALSTLLRKTLGGGNYFGGETPPSITGYARINVTDFVSDKLNIGAPYDISGNIEVFLYINTTTGLVKIYAWDNVDSFIDITTFAPFTLIQDLYLRYASDFNNPIIQSGNVLRFISGKQAYNGENLIQNGWMGWIDRYMYNYLYKIPAGFYIYNAPVPTNIKDLSFDISSRTISTEDPGDQTKYYYRYSLVYDYRQEGLLSYIIGSIELYENEGAVIDITISNAIKYKRLTSINVYRSEDKKYNYELISTIPVSGEAKGLLIGDDASCLSKIFFNNDDVYNHGFIPDSYYLLIQTASGNMFDGITNFEETGTGHKILTLDMTEAHWTAFFTSDYASSPITSWTLMDNTLSTTIASGTGADLKWGYKTVCFSVDPDYAGSITVDDIVFLNTKTRYTISSIMYDSYGNVSLDLNESVITDYANRFMDRPFTIFTPGVEDNGFLISYDDGLDKAIFAVYDDRLTGIFPHPLDGEVSIQVNANHACYLNGRLFLIDGILDPENTAEDHNDLLMYSEYLQPDVVPVSNAISCDNPFGGESMGLAPFFDSLLIIMKHTIYQLRTIDITSPNSWVLTESPHKIGCISNKGYVVAAGSLYVAYYDGIYEFTPNMLAESDRTPVESMRISEPINNLYMRLEDSEKENLVLRHDKIRNEIMVDVIDISETEVTIFKTLCYDLTYKTWRVDKYNSDPVNDAVEFYNQESHLIQWDDGDGSFIDINSPGARAVSWKSKTYVHEYEKYEIIKTMAVTYYSGDAVTVAIYDAEKGTSLFSKTLEAKTAPGTEKFGVRVRAKKYYIKVSATSSSNEVEIYRIVVESERSLS